MAGNTIYPQDFPVSCELHCISTLLPSWIPGDAGCQPERPGPLGATDSIDS